MQLPDEAAFLVKEIRDGRAFLLLGAGSSVTSKNRSGKPIKAGGQLAHLIASEAAIAYADDKLPDVIQAVVGRRLSEMRFHEILKQEYLGSEPSSELIALFQYGWTRVYTLNVDDTIERLRSFKSGQHELVLENRTGC